MNKLMIILCATFLAACDNKPAADQKESWQWSVEFCGKKDDIKRFDIMPAEHIVECKDGRRVTIPGTSR